MAGLVVHCLIQNVAILQGSKGAEGTAGGGGSDGGDGGDVASEPDTKRARRCWPLATSACRTAVLQRLQKLGRTGRAVLQDCGAPALAAAAQTPHPSRHWLCCGKVERMVKQEGPRFCLPRVLVAVPGSSVAAQLLGSRFLAITFEKERCQWQVCCSLTVVAMGGCRQAPGQVAQILSQAYFSG